MEESRAAWIETVEEPKAEGDVKEHHESCTARVANALGVEADDAPFAEDAGFRAAMEEGLV